MILFILIQGFLLLTGDASLFGHRVPRPPWVPINFLDDVSDHVAYLDDVPDHVALQEVSPHAAGKLGETKAECEEEGKPEVVRGHRRVLN